MAWTEEDDKAFNKATKPRSPWQRFTDELWDGAASNWIGVRGIRTIAENMGPGRVLRGDTARRAEKHKERAARGREQDAPFFEDVDTLSPANIGKWVVDLSGNIIGGADPTYPLAPGRTIVQKALGQGAINAGVDAVNQGVDIARGDQDRVDPRRLGINAGAGVVLGGAGELAGRAIARGGGNLDLDTAVKIGDKFGVVTSTVRSPARNKKVGGAKNSHHLYGRAIDIARGKGITHKQIERAYRRAGYDIIESLDEGDHSHFAFRLGGKGKAAPENIAQDGAPAPASVRPVDPREMAEIMGDNEMLDALNMRAVDDALRQADDSDNAAPIEAYELNNLSDALNRSFEAGEIDGPSYLSMMDEIEKKRLGVTEGENISSIHTKSKTPTSKGDWTSIDSPNNVTQFPGERIVNPDQVGPVEPNDVRQLPEGVTDLGAVRNSNITNNRVADFNEHSRVAEEILNASKKGNPPLTLKEAIEMSREMDRFDDLTPLSGPDRDALNKLRNKWDEVLEAIENNMPRRVFSDETTKKTDADYWDRVRNELQLSRPEDVKEGNKPRSLTQLLKDLWNDESGEWKIDPDGVFARKPSNTILNPKPELIHEETRMSSYNGDGKTVPAVRVYDKNTGETFAIARARPFENKASRIKRAYATVKRMLKDDSGEVRGDDTDGTAYEQKLQELDPEDRLVKLLKKPQRLNTEQRRMYYEERSKRSGNLANIQAKGGGRESLIKQKASQKGELPKVDFESFAKHFSDDDFTQLANKINFSSRLLPFEKFRALDALDRLLGREGGKLPQPNELRLLSQVYSPDLIKALMDNREFMQRLQHATVSTLNIPRAIMASVDLSAPFRQGITFVHKGAFWKNFVPMIRALTNERYSKGLMTAITEHPNWEKAKLSGLAIVDPHSHFLAQREEPFQSDLADKYLPPVKWSNRAYSAFLNKLRFDVFNDLVGKYEATGRALDPKELKDIAKFVNSFSGRGSLGKTGDKAAPALAIALFSPRLIASRIQVLASPLTYLKADPILRKEAWKSLLSYSAYVGTILSFGKYALGMDVEDDPRSSDWGKLKDGNTRVDVTGGFQSYIRLGAQILSHTKVTGKGEVRELGGGLNDPAKGPYDESIADLFGRFFRSKESPVVSLIHNFFDGENVVGEPFYRTKELPGGVKVNAEVLERVTPMGMSDLSEIFQDEGFLKALKYLPASVTFGTQTYTPRKPKEKKIEDSFQDIEESFKKEDFGQSQDLEKWFSGE